MSSIHTKLSYAHRAHHTHTSLPNVISLMSQQHCNQLFPGMLLRAIVDTKELCVCVCVCVCVHVCTKGSEAPKIYFNQLQIIACQCHTVSVARGLVWS